MVRIDEYRNAYRWPAVLSFIVCGAVSVYLFFLITSLPMLQGASDYWLMAVVSIAWVLIFPSWIILFLVTMWLLDVLNVGHNKHSNWS